MFMLLFFLDWTGLGYFMLISMDLYKWFDGMDWLMVLVLILGYSV